MEEDRYWIEAATNMAGEQIIDYLFIGVLFCHIFFVLLKITLEIEVMNCAGVGRKYLYY